MDKRIAPRPTQAQKFSIQRVEDKLGGIWRHCLSTQEQSYLHWSPNITESGEGYQRASISAHVTKGRLGKMWVYYTARLGTWWHRIWKRPKYQTLPLSGSRSGLQESQVIETVEKGWIQAKHTLSKGKSGQGILKQTRYMNCSTDSQQILNSLAQH